MKKTIEINEQDMLDSMTSEDKEYTEKIFNWTSFGLVLLGTIMIFGIMIIADNLAILIIAQSIIVLLVIFLSLGIKIFKKKQLELIDRVNTLNGELQEYKEQDLSIGEGGKNEV